MANQVERASEALQNALQQGMRSLQLALAACPLCGKKVVISSPELGNCATCNARLVVSEEVARPSGAL